MIQICFVVFAQTAHNHGNITFLVAYLNYLHDVLFSNLDP